MRNPFSAALAVLHGSVVAVEAVYTPLVGNSVPLRVIRAQGTKEVDGYLVDTEEAQIQRSDVDAPEEGASLILSVTDQNGTVVGQETFRIQGGARLDSGGLTWNCYLEPV